MMLPSRLGCPLSLKTPNMGNPGLVLEEAVGNRYEDAECAIISQIPLNPSWLVSGLWIEPMGRTRYLAREAIVARGEPIERDTDWYWWDGADEYRLLIDADCGLLLRIGVFRNVYVGSESLCRIGLYGGEFMDSPPVGVRRAIRDAYRKHARRDSVYMGANTRKAVSDYS